MRDVRGRLYGNMEIHWLPDVFRCDWSIEWKKDMLEKIDEKIILLAIVGNLEAIKNGGITVDKSEKFLFSPYMINKLRAKSCDLQPIHSQTHYGLIRGGINGTVAI